MTKFKIILGTLLMGIGLWGCSNISEDMSPPMTQVSLQICGDKVIDNQIEKACYSNTTIYWGEISKDDIHLVKMTPKINGKLDYYFVVVSATGCVSDLSEPRPTKTEIVALKSMFSEKISDKLPEVKLSSFIEVEEKKENY